MQNIRRRFLLSCFKMSDLLVMSICFYWALYETVPVVSSVPFSQLFRTKVVIHDLVFYIFMLAVWWTTFTLFGLYRSKRFAAKQSEIVDILSATTSSCILIFLFGMLLKIRFLRFEFITYLWFLSNVFTVLYRIVLRYFLKKIRVRGRNLRRMLIIGTNKRAIEFANKLINKPELGYVITGFVDDEWYADKKLLTSSYSIVCNFDEIKSYIRERVVDEVMITIPVKSHYNEASKIVSICEEQGIIVRHVSNIYNHKKDRPGIEFFGDIPSIRIYESAIHGWPAFFKRLIDVTLAPLLLTILSPLVIIVAVAIILSSPGPVFFIQKRVGYGKRIFRLYKFRTMFQGAEENQNEIEYLNEASGPVFKIKSDPRITRLGKYLRKTSIDELPQLINVIKGDMSLVGPRPLPVRDYNGFNEDWHRRRFTVRPGITCLWQIQGRSTILFERWMELDMEYIDQWSLWLDIKILLKTIPTVLRGVGAT